MMGPRGVTWEEVVNICVCNFVLIESKNYYVWCICAVFVYCKNKTASAYFPSVFFRASVFLLHLRMQGVVERIEKGTV